MHIHLNGVAADVAVKIVQLVFQIRFGKNFIRMADQRNQNSPFTVGQIQVFALELGQALFNIQNNYPGVHYLLFDGEPHNSSYTNYTTESNVHCVLFQEEQAGFLAGYAAVTDGYTQLGFIGAEEIPGVVRYVTGFLQGAEYAAEQQGLTVDLRTWFAGTYSASDDTTRSKA